MGQYEFRSASRGELRFMKGERPFRLAASEQFYISTRACSACGNVHHHLPLAMFPLLRQFDGNREALGWTLLMYTCPDNFQQATLMLSPTDAERAVRAMKRG